MRVCLDCPVLTDQTRCEPCRKKKRRAEDQRRPGARARGYNEHWARTRRDYLAAFPICQHEHGCLEQAVDVHHLDGQGPLGEHGHDWGNLQGLCKPHHSQITATSQPGGWAA